MKFSKSISILSLFLSISLFTSCENEPLDEDFLSQQQNSTNTGENGATNNVNEEDSSGDYWPRAIGNEWNYDSSFYGNVSYDMISTEAINGVDNYYKFDQLFGAVAWLRKSGDVYYTRQSAADLPIQGYDITTTPLEIAILKDSAQVGETWSVDVDYTVSYTSTTAGLPDLPDADVQATYSFEMIERDGVRVVENVEYENVLHVKLTLTSSGVLDTTDYYYAKDIGLIEYMGSTEHSKLLSYNLN